MVFQNLQCKRLLLFAVIVTAVLILFRLYYKRYDVDLSGPLLGPAAMGELGRGAKIVPQPKPRNGTAILKLLEKMKEPVKPSMPPCNVANLGPLKVMKITNVTGLYSGKWKPVRCQPLESVAIVIPFQNWFEQLETLVSHLHFILQKQKLQYGIYVIEQVDSKPFNRGKLLNAGYLESLSDSPYNCLILHDVDMIPEDSRLLYRCDNRPMYLVGQLRSGYKLNYRISNDVTANGQSVLAILPAQYRLVNGMSNQHWGPGAHENENFALRMKVSGLEARRASGDEAVFHHRLHPKRFRQNWRMPSVNEMRDEMLKDGLNSVQYTLLRKTSKDLYTLLSVKL